MSAAMAPSVQLAAVLLTPKPLALQHPLQSKDSGPSTFGNEYLRVPMGLAVFLVGFCVSFYISTWASFILRRQSRGGAKVPPMVPYGLPFIGHAVSFALNPVKFLTKVRQFTGRRQVHGLNILGHHVYFIYKPENIARLRKYPTTITTPGVTTFVLKTLFGMASKAVDAYTLDESGVTPNPKPGTQISAHNRVDYLTHANFHKHLLGEGLPKIYRNFSSSLARRLPLLDVQEEWRCLPDVMDFWLPTMTSAMNEAIAGPLLECVNPSFTQNLLKYYPYLQSLMKGTPRLLVPEAYQLQESLIGDVKIWHAIARARFQESEINPETGNDPWWGSAFIRERQQMLKKVDGWDYESIASSDFGVLWGASVNIHPMAILGITEVFRNKHLLSRVRTELEAVNFSGTVSYEDVEKLLTIPLLQSIYSELLRLHVEVQTIFNSDKEDIRINEWKIPRHSLVVVPAGEAHRDPSCWNTRNGEYPLNTFWADRFLVYPGDPHSGPRKPTSSAVSDHRLETPKTCLDNKNPRFVNSGLADSFMPYGIGERTCPGRGFARREIVAFCALIAHSFDVEILATDKDFERDSAFYGIGTQRPRNRIPFKIRRRMLS